METGSGADDVTIDLGTIAKGVDLNANVSTADGDDTVTMMADGITPEA